MMMNESDVKEIPAPTSDTTVLQLVAEVERLRKYILDYNVSISAKMDVIENDVDRMEAENARLLNVKEGLCVERDACIALAMKIALANGMKVGMAPGNIVVAELPSGQVSWPIEASEAHLFEDLPPYSGEVENLSIEENYGRIMNPGMGERS